jgi:hypothetical protein
MEVRSQRRKQLATNKMMFRYSRIRPIGASRTGFVLLHIIRISFSRQDIKDSRLGRRFAVFTHHVMGRALQMIRAPCEQRALHMTADERLRKAVFQVGDGRGFKVGHFVITAAHCIPNLPPRGQTTCTGERTYKLLGPLGVKGTIWVELLFADQIGNLAILGQPANQELTKEAESYDRLLEGTPGFAIANVRANKQINAKVLSLSGQWISCSINHYGGALQLEGAAIESGMSGSPIISRTGKAVGVVCGNSETDGVQITSINIRLMRGLPRWFPLRSHRFRTSHTLSEVLQI